MTEGAEGSQWVSVQEASRLLDTTEGAIRKRVQRGSLESDHGADGRVYVRVDAGRTRQDNRHDAGGRADSGAESGVEAELRARVESLERSLEAERAANRENRRLLAAALEHLPELESGESPREQGEDALISSTEGSGGVGGPTGGGASERSSQRPWWRKWFGR